MSRPIAAAKTALLGLAGAVAVNAAAHAAAMTDQSAEALAHDILKQLVEINTTDSVGNVTTAAEAMAKRFRDAGFPAADVVVVGPDNPRKKNVVVRLHGTGQHKPILMIGHLDVVEARREDWSVDPFKLTEKDGYFYGRGSLDMKDGDAIMSTALLRLRQAGFKPDRDLILALTADEEGGKSNGVDWLLKNHRDLIEAEFVINSDSGGVDLSHGKAISFNVGATEKLYADYQLTAINPGGHSSLPVPDNAIYHIADSLTRLQAYTFPFELNPITRLILPA
jgi:acetylornithine deacetylase/succinyl-diaminopimelate desuccinylase-like protein